MLNDDDLKNLKMDKVIEKAMPVITKYCYHRVAYNFQDAEEIANDVMMLLSMRWDFLDKSRLLSWLFRVADKYISRYWRKKAAFEKKKAKNKIEIVHIDDLLPQDEPGKEDDYNEFLFADDIQRYIEDICNNLTNDELNLYIYRYRDRKTLAEISNITNIPYTTLHNRYEKLDEKIREMAKELIEKTILH